MEIEDELFNVQWQTAIDQYLLDNNSDKATVLNPQEFVVDESMKRDIQVIQASRHEMRLKAGSSSLSVARAGDSRRSTLLDARESGCEGVAEELAYHDAEGKLKAYTPNVLMWAGYIPPGKHTIFIYDRVNKAIWQKDVLIESRGYLRHSSVPTHLHLPHYPRQLTQEELDEIDASYEQEI